MICYSLKDIEQLPLQTINTILDSQPVFLHELYTEGQINPQIVGNLMSRLNPSDLAKFITKMTQETNFFVTASTCRTITDIEIILMDLLPIVRATVWLKTNHADFLYSPTMNTNLPLAKSIVGYCAVTARDLITGDPSNHFKFDIDIDLPLLRNAKSMILLPIQTITDDVVGVLQVVGLINQVIDEQIEFSDYYVECLKIVRNIIQDQLFGADPPQEIPSITAKIFKKIPDRSLSKVSTKIINFLKEIIPCEGADIYEFDDRKMKMTRLTDGQEFVKENGGISYAAALKDDPINIPHGSTHHSFCKEIDGCYTNRSILSRSLYYNHEHYVITLRAKWKSLSFIPSDLDLLASLSPFLCEAIRLSREAAKQEKEHKDVLRHQELLNVVCQSMGAFTTNGLDRWKTLNNIAQKCCCSEKCFVCAFDGRNMKYYPSQILWKFDDCTAGNAYNFRELTISGDGTNLIQKELYDQLGVKASRVVAFPFRIAGKVAGAIELINPSLDKIDSEVQTILGNYISFLFGDSFSHEVLA